MKTIRRIVVIGLITLVSLELVTRLWFGGLASALHAETLNVDGNLFPDGLFIANGVLAIEYDGIAPTGIHYETNVYGLRDDPIQDDIPLWVFLGDSTTFGLNIAHEDTYAEQMEQMMNGTIQSINAAVPGWGAGKQRDMLAQLLAENLTIERIFIGVFANDGRNAAVYAAGDNPPSFLDESVLYQIVNGLIEQAKVEAALNTDWRTTGRNSSVWDNPDWQQERVYLDAIIALAGERPITLLYIPYSEDDVLNDSPLAHALAEYATKRNLVYVNGVTVYTDYLTRLGLDSLPNSFYSHGNDMAHPSVLTSRLLAQALYKGIYDGHTQ